MTAPNPLSNIGDLSKPATTLIEKISDAIGGIAKPWQIVRIAKADAVASKLKAQAQIEISKAESLVIKRSIAEESIKQKNMDSIITKTVPQVEDHAHPERLDNDWLASFFEKGKLVSDDEMQLIWSKILAGEANSPGSFSKRTIDALSVIDKSDALLFQNLCRY